MIELNLPPGVVRMATELTSAGRWYDTNLVRWVDGVMRPMRGWFKLSGGAGPTVFSLTGKARGSHAYKANSGAPFLVIGTHSKLYVYNGSNLFDITPAGLTVGRESTVSYLGYGRGPYGRGAYGAPRTSAGTPALATTWAMDNFGEILLGVHSDDGRLIEWTGSTGTPAAVVTATSGTVPTNNKSVVVTEQRFCFVLGAGGDGRKVQWADIESYKAWATSATSQAGDYLLTTLGTIRCGTKVRKQVLIHTEVDAHIAEYVGPPFVYGISRIGTGCGIISPQACEAADDAAYWMGFGSFFAYDGAVRTLECPVSDLVFTDMNSAQTEKVHSVRLPEFKEVIWFYPSAASTEVDRYVLFNYVTNVWAVGSLARTTGVSTGVFPTPILVGADGFVYGHESGSQYDGQTPFAESGPVELGDGSRVYTLDSIVPDERTAGQVQATFTARTRPNKPEVVRGPYTLSSPTSVRVTGRQIKIKLSGDGDWRVGRFRFDGKAKGRL